MSAFTETLVTIALAEVGVKEVGSSNRGPRVDQYQRATWLEEKDWGAWCASFVCWCVREAMRSAGVKETAGFKRPRTAGAFDFERWSLAQDATTATRKPAGKDIQRGDLVIFSFSHIGIALGPPDKQGMLQTVDGNSNARGSRTGGMVCTVTRNIDLVRSRIRFTI
jgi:cell wall-associated NlpC family hydrolase